MADPTSSSDLATNAGYALPYAADVTLTGVTGTAFYNAPGSGRGLAYFVSPVPTVGQLWPRGGRTNTG